MQSKEAALPQLSHHRVDSLDVARGLGLIAMAVFHTAWDLSFLGIAEIDIAGHRGWINFARIIAATFLFIAGFSLVLASHNQIRWRPFLRRLAIIVAAASVVSLGTWFFVTVQFVAFGILHHIAAASLIGLLLLRFSSFWIIAAALLALALPFAIEWDGDGYGFGYLLGIAPGAPPSVDYVPLFPWLAAGFMGMATAKYALRYRPDGLWVRWQAKGKPFSILALMGRWSLPIYLLHQPLIIGVLMGFMALSGLSGDARNAPETESFHKECLVACQGFGRTNETCERACVCTQATLKQENLWEKTLQNRLATSEIERLQSLARTCALTP